VTSIQSEVCNGFRYYYYFDYFLFLVGLYFVLTDLTALVFLLRTVVVNKAPERLDFCSNSPISPPLKPYQIHP
jgi:hypothetical protein